MSKLGGEEAVAKSGPKRSSGSTSLGVAFARASETQAAQVVAERFGITAAEVQRLDTELDDTFRVRAEGADSWTNILKIAHPHEDLGPLLLQGAILRRLARPGNSSAATLRVPVPVTPVTPVPPTNPTQAAPGGTRDTAPRELPFVNFGEGARAVRLFDFVPGELRSKRPLDADGRRDLGRQLARLDAQLATIEHPAADRPLDWGIDGLWRLRSRLNAVPDAGQRAVLDAFLDELEHQVLPVIKTLPRQLVHGDANFDNVLVGAEGQAIGLIDFGDVAMAPVVWEVAVAASYEAPTAKLLAGADPALAWSDASELRAGYEEVRPFSAAEAEVFGLLAAARVAQRYVMGLWLASQRPDNATYALRHHETVWQQFAALLQGLLLNEAAAPETAPETTTTAPTLAERRERVLSPAYRLFYREPLELVSGSGTRVVASDGRQYLDAYNNVPCVGHAHPRVVQAIAEQAARLNTHTRYLSEPLVAYAERIGALLPAGVDRLTFTCTGSEANDLALRIAKFYTGQQGVVVTEHAYHGITTEVAAVSPSLGGPAALAPWVRTVRAPIDGRPEIAAEGFANVADWFAAEVENAVDDLVVSGHGLAALLIDTVCSSDGLVVGPTGAASPLAAAARVVQGRGGLLIADEVQAGFARTGEAFWGLSRHGLTPDIVTMGKPMGAGMPIAAVAARPELLEKFGHDVRYFNTFGGNAVSIAAATAVLDVIESEDLQGNVSRVGAWLGAALEGLAAESAELSAGACPLGPVRGVGLFWAVVTPSAKMAAELVEYLREHGVLLSATGPNGNVLKIRPPLVFSRADAEELVATLREGVRAQGSATQKP